MSSLLFDKYPDLINVNNISLEHLENIDLLNWLLGAMEQLPGGKERIREIANGMVEIALRNK